MTPWLKSAEADLGIHEVAGEGAHPRIIEMFSKAGHPEVKSDETAWCAAAVGCWLQENGIKPTGALNARSYLDWGTNLPDPVLGCIVVMERPPDPDAGHVAIYKRTVGDQIEVIGGNQADGVSVTRFPASRVINYRWPTGVPMTNVASEVAATSSKFSLATWLQRLLAPSSVGLGLVSQPDLTQSVGALSVLGKTVKDAGINGLLALAIAFAVFVILLEVFKAKTVEDAASGRYTPSGETKTTKKDATA